MSGYLVTARKWRPKYFEEVAGQDHVTTTLRNALRSGRLAHAYLFSGPRGVGKTTTARLLAKTVNCLQPKDANPDNSCENCLEITEGRSFDVQEIDGASNRGVDEIRNLREAVRYAPAKGRYRVYIIDEVHMLTKEAFNALLKTLEEPPPHVLFVFATTELHKVPPTIVSRCQRFDFRRIGMEAIRENLRSIAAAEEIVVDEPALVLLARRADGSLRDAQSLFDQAVSLCGREVSARAILDAFNIVDQELYFRAGDLIEAHDARGALQMVDDLLRQGHDIREFLGGLGEFFRNLLVAKETDGKGLLELSEAERHRYVETAVRFTRNDLLRYLRFVQSSESALRWSTQPRFRLEADMVQLVTLARAPDVASILAELQELKKKGLEQFSGLTPSAFPDRHTISTSVDLRHTDSGPARRVRTETPLPPSEAPAVAITDDEIRARWGEFIGEVRRQKISLGSVLEATSVLGLRGSVLRVGCANDFQSSAIARNREKLAEIGAGVFHVRLRLEPVLEQPAVGTVSAPPPEEEDHPVIAALRRELGAEPIDP